MTPEQTMKLRAFAQDEYPETIRRAKLKSGFEQFYAVIETAFLLGLQSGLGAEERAWNRVTEVEDLLIDLMRYAPDREIAKAREIERQSMGPEK